MIIPASLFLSRGSWWFCWILPRWTVVYSWGYYRLSFTQIICEYFIKARQWDSCPISVQNDLNKNLNKALEIFTCIYMKLIRASNSDLKYQWRQFAYWKLLILRMIYNYLGTDCLTSEGWLTISFIYICM